MSPLYYESGSLETKAVYGKTIASQMFVNNKIGPNSFKTKNIIIYRLQNRLH